MVSGELKSLFETTPLFNQNNCGALNASEAEIRSADSRRVRKSRGEQLAYKKIGPMELRHSKNACNFLGVRMKVNAIEREF